MVPGAVVLTFAVVVAMVTAETFGVRVQIGEVLGAIRKESEDQGIAAPYCAARICP